MSRHLGRANSDVKIRRNIRFVVNDLTHHVVGEGKYGSFSSDL